MVGNADHNSSPADWPAILAARAIRSTLIERIFSELSAELSDRDPHKTCEEALPGIGVSILKRFFTSLANQVGRRRMKQWFQFLLEANQLAGDQKRKERTHEAENLWSAFSKLGLTRFDEVINDTSKRDQLCRLFELLLGICIMRPIIGDVYTDSSVYYSAIDHPLLDESSKQLILESVIVPPGAGSVGRCLREGSYCVSISFGDYAGVVEWQDLVQGNISILMVRIDTDIYDDNRTKMALSYVVMAFFPLSGIFDEVICPPKNPAKTNYLSSSVHECKELLNMLNECARGNLRDHSILDLQVSTINSDTLVTPHITGALLDYQDIWRSRRVFQEAIHSGTEINLDKLAGSIVDRLIPKSFTDLPVPLAAAGALIRDPITSYQPRLAHLRVTRRALESAFEATVPYDLFPIIAQQYPRNSNDLVTSGPDDSPIGNVGTLYSPNTLPVEFSRELYSSDILYLGPDDEQFEAVWAIHASPDQQAEWPTGSKYLAELIHKPLAQIIRVAEMYAGWHSMEQYQEWWEWLKNRVEVESLTTISIYAQFKLRDNLGERYYSLISRLLFADEEMVDRRYNELRFMLTICATPPGNEVPEEIKEVVDQACDAALKLRKLIIEDVGSRLIGTSSCVRMRHHLYWSVEERERTKEAVIERLGEDVWKTLDNSFGYIRRLIHQLQIRGALVRKRFPQQYRLEDDRFRWDKLYDSDLRLNDPEVIDGVVHVNSDLCINGKAQKEEMKIRCLVRPKLTFLTELHPVHSRDLWNHLISKSAGALDLAQIESFLQLNFRPLLKSESKTNGKLNAALYVGSNSRDSGATELYLKKVEPIANLFKEMMDERFQAVQAAEKVAEEQGRARMAELLVSGTSHALKIPIQVAKARAEKGESEKAARILEIAVPFVHIGAYIQDQERNRRDGTYTEGDRVKWVPASDEVHPNAVVIKRSVIEEWFATALEYVSIARKDGGTRNIVRLLMASTSDIKRFHLIWELEREYFLNTAMGPVLKRASPESGVFQAALLELLANAIAYANPTNPRVRVQISLDSEDVDQLLIRIANNCEHEPQWKNSGEFESFLSEDAGVVGIRTAKAAIQALGWTLEPSIPEWDDQRFQGFDVRAPIGKEVKDVQHFMG